MPQRHCHHAHHYPAHSRPTAAMAAPLAAAPLGRATLHPRTPTSATRHLAGNSSCRCSARAGLLQQQQQRRLPVLARASSGSLDEPGVASTVVWSQQHADTAAGPPVFPVEVPLLPFPVEELLLPGSVKALHLFEARYLALLDAVLAAPGPNKVFGFVVVEQPGEPFGETAAAFPGAYTGDTFVLTMATLVRVVEVRKSSVVGAMVRIQAEARVAVSDVTQTLPYLKGHVAPLCDHPVADPQLVAQQVERLSQTMQDLQNLTQRFKSRQSASLLHSMNWSGRPAFIAAAAPAVLQELQQQQQQPADTDAPASSSSSSSGSLQQSGVSDGEASSEANSLAEQAARLSFAALQGVPQESGRDQLKLLRCCVNAMKGRDTSDRLAAVEAHMQHGLHSLAAKCALASLNLGSSQQQPDT